MGFPIPKQLQDELQKAVPHLRIILPAAAGLAWLFGKVFNHGQHSEDDAANKMEEVIYNEPLFSNQKHHHIRTTYHPKQQYMYISGRRRTNRRRNPFPVIKRPQAPVFSPTATQDNPHQNHRTNLHRHALGLSHVW